MKTLYSKTAAWVLVFMLTFGISAPLLAQDSTPAPTDIESQVEIPGEGEETDQVEFIETDTQGGGEPEPLAELLNGILNTVAGVVVFTPAAGGLVLVATSLTKRLPIPFGSNLIALFYMTILWLIYFFVQQLGFDAYWEQVLDILTQAGYLAVGVTGTQLVSVWFYDKSKAANVPIVGYSRHEEVSNQ